MAKNIAFVFPGQGAQYSGMGKDFYNQYEKAKQIYDYASEICNIDVKKSVLIVLTVEFMKQNIHKLQFLLRH